jgi:hypothetical protein
MPTWRLEDATPRAAAHKYTFYKAGPDEISQVRPGENVKLIFEFDSDDPKAPGAERMWVLVDEVLGGGHFVGRLDNNPQWISDLEPGDRVEFRDIHIINTELDDDNNLVNRYLPRCFVTNRVLHDGQKIGYLYREQPDNEKDSGWRIMAGDESDAYMDDSKNISFVSLGAVLARDDSMIHLLDAPAGSAFRRNHETGGFDPTAPPGP